MYRQLGLNSLPLDMGTPVGPAPAAPQAGIGGPTMAQVPEPQAPLSATMTMEGRRDLIRSLISQGKNYDEVMAELTAMGVYDPTTPAPTEEEAFERPGFGTVLRQGAQQIGQDSATGIGLALDRAGFDEAGKAVTDAGTAMFGLTPEEQAARQQAAEEDRYGRDVADAIVGSAPSFAMIGAGSWAGGKAGATAGGLMGGPAGALVGGTIGAALGGIMSSLPMMLGGATETAKANGADVSDPAVQNEIIRNGAVRSVLETIGPNVALGILKGPAKEIVSRSVARGAFGGFTKVGVAEGTTEVLGELLDIATFDPEVRSKLSPEEVQELAPLVAEKYGRELSIAFIAGKAVGGAAGGVSGGVEQSKANAQRRMELETLAEAAREGGLDFDVLEAASKDPAKLPLIAQGARDVGAARAEVERARQIIEAGRVANDPELVTQGQERLKAAVEKAEAAYNSVIPKLGGLDRAQVKAKAQLEIDRARDDLRKIGVLPDSIVDGLDGQAARKYADQIASARTRMENAQTAIDGPEGFDTGKREALQKELDKAKRDYQDTVDTITVRSGAKTPESLKAERENRDYNAAIDRQYERKFKPLIDKGDTDAARAEAEKIIKGEAKGKNKGLQTRLRKLERDLDRASTTAEIDAIEKDIAEVQKRMGREAPVVAAAKRAIQTLNPQQGTGPTQGVSPVVPTPTPDPAATPGQGTQTPTTVAPSAPTAAPAVEPVTAPTAAPAVEPVTAPPVEPAPTAGPDTGTVTPPSGSPDGGTIVAPSKIEVEPDGTQTEIYPDGTRFTRNPDGSTMKFEPDGTTTVVAPDKITTLIKRPDGSDTLIKPDGTRVDKEKDGSMTTVSPDGTVTSIEADGTTNVMKPDGSMVTTQPDGTTVTIPPAGNPKVTKPTTTPSGTPIKKPAATKPETKPEPKPAPKKTAKPKGMKYNPAMVNTKQDTQGWVDMLADFNRVNTTLATARKWILDKEKKNKVEYIVAFDSKTGEVLGVGTINKVNSVAFPRTMMDAINAGRAVTAVHNHPSGSSLSPQDSMMAFTYPNLTIVAVTDRGIQYTAKAKPKGASAFKYSKDGLKMRDSLEAAMDSLMGDTINDLVAAKVVYTNQPWLTTKEREQIWHGVTRAVNRTFANMGYMQYTETNAGSASVLEIEAYDAARKRANKTIRTALALHGAGLKQKGTGEGVQSAQRSDPVRSVGPYLESPIDGDPNSLGDQTGGTADGVREGTDGTGTVGSRQARVTRPAYAFQRLPSLPARSPGPNQRLARAAIKYMVKGGITPRRQADYVKVDTGRAERIAQAYADMKHDPQNPEVKAAYEALARETEAQYEALLETGIQIELMPDDMPDPYPEGPKQVLRDMLDNNHLWIFPTDSGYGQTAITDQDIADNPLLAMSRHRDVNGKPMRVNDLFRAVHDAFGHGREGVGFGPEGEENTWQSHVRMFSPQAARAMTSETRGQNSWVNYGPYGEQNRLDPRNTIYAEQKIGLMPEWTMEEGVGDQPSPGEMDVLMAEAAERMAEKNAEIERLMQIEGPLRMMRRDGRSWGVITPSTYGGPWRLTRIDSKGPFGHGDYPSREAAIRAAVMEDNMIGTDANGTVDEQTGLSESQSLTAVEDIMPKFKRALSRAESDLEVPGWLDIRTENGRAYQDMLDRAKTPVSTLGTIFKWIERQGINAFAPIRDLELDLHGELGVGMDSAFKAAEIAVNDAGRNEALMHYGAAKLGKNGEYTVAPGTIGIKDMLAKLGQGQSVIDWMEYMGARRAQEIKAKGFKTPLSDEDIAAGLAKETAVFKEVAADWKRFNDANVDFVVASGRISKELGQALKDDAAYVPFYRTDTAVNGTPDLAAEAEMIAAARAQPKIGTQVLSRNPGIYKLKGDETLRVNNLIENMIRNSQAMVAAGMRNQAANKVFNLLQEAGMVEVQRARTKNKKGKYVQRAKPENSVRMWKDGRESYIVPLTREAQPMMIALGGLQPVRLTGIADAMAKIGSFFRQSITLSPAFIIRNMIRDVVSTGVLFNGRNLTWRNNAFTGFRSSLRNSASRAMYTTATGMGDFRFGGGDIGLGRNDLMIELGIQPKTMAFKFRQFVGKLEEWGTASELANRIAVFESLKESGVRSDEAAYQALTIVNYGRRGASHALRTLLPMVPFLNARIQGLARIYEPAVTLRGEARTKALKELALSGAVLSTFSAALWAYNNDDEERREKFEAEPLHRRLNYHVVYVGDRKILIPKAFEIGTIFSSVPEFAMEAMLQGDTDELGAATTMTLWNTFGFNPIPAAMLPAIEVLMDYNMFTGRPIEGPRLESLMREDRINPQTAALAVGLARSGLGDFTGLSPVNMDHLLNGYGGVAYQMLATMVDTVGGDLGLLPSRPEGVFGTVPILSPTLDGTFRSMYKDAEADSANRYVEDFYAVRQSITQLYRSAKAAAEAGDVARAKELLAAAPATPAAYKLVNRANKRLGDINSLMREIRQSPNLSSREKQERLSVLIKERNRISAGVMKVIRQAEENQGTSFKRAAA